MTEVAEEPTGTLKTCKAPVRTPPPTYKHSVTYRVDVLPDAHPTATKGNKLLSVIAEVVTSLRRNLLKIWTLR